MPDSPSFALSTFLPENAASLDRMVRALDLAEGFALFIARCNISVLRRQLIELATQRLATLGVSVVDIEFNGEITHLRNRLRTELATIRTSSDAVVSTRSVPSPELAFVHEPTVEYYTASKRVLFITGLEHSIPYGQPDARILAELNLGRDLFRRDAPVPLVFWLPDYAVTAIARDAPDFWAWRSGVFEFFVADAERSAAVHQFVHEGPGWMTLTNLTRETRLTRRRQLESLLDNYHDLADNDRVARERMDLLFDLGQVCAASQEYSDALTHYQEAIKIARRVGDRTKEGPLLNNIGLVYDAMGEKQEALHYYEQALPLVRQLGSGAGEAATLNNIGLVYYDLGEKQKALRYFEDALTLMRREGDRPDYTGTLINIGRVYDDLGEKQEALRYYEQALSSSRQVDDTAGEATTLNNIGNVYDDLGEKQNALRLYEQALQLQRQVSDRAGEATTLHNIGAVYSAMGAKHEALRHYRQALSLVRQLGDRWAEARTLSNIGATHADLGDKQQALQCYEQALLLRRQVGDRVGEGETLNNIGKVHDDFGEKIEALRYYEQAQPILHQVGDQASESITRFNVARVYEYLGDLIRAEEQLRQVVALDEATSLPTRTSNRAALARVREKLTMRNDSG